MKTTAVIIAILAILGFGGYKYIKHQEWISKTVPCESCGTRFIPEDNKAPILGAALAGAAVGGTAGAVGGAAVGAGTGLAVGGVGAVPGAPVGAAIGGVGGVIVGGIGGAWYRDKRVKCPNCGLIFLNPKN